jgi:hypothetical protein
VFSFYSVAASASGRAKLIKVCIKIFDIKSLIIEKVFAQNSSELDMITTAKQVE